MKSLQEYFDDKMFNSFCKEDYIIEGINIDTKRKTISLTDNHNKGIDFSLVNNPIYSELNKIPVISIFKRTKLKSDYNIEVDGNPFIYALKGKFDWKFDISYDDIKKYINRFLDICDKIKKKYDTIIIVPSSSDINNKFMRAIKDKLSCSNIISDYFVKLSKEDIINNDLIDYDKINNNLTIINKIRNGFAKMKGESFEAKYIPKECLQYIKYIDDNGNNIAEKINGMDILILDDIVSSGETLSQCAENILSNFAPKSITIITLLSEINGK